MQEHISLFIFSLDNFVRKACIKMSIHRYFERFILVIIFANSITLAMNNYEDPAHETRRNQILDYFSACFTWVFAVEAVIKIIAQGFVVSPTAYIREPLNVLDFVIVVSGMTEFFLEIYFYENANDSGAGGILGIFRILRIIRPLRSVRAMPTMRKLIKALLNSIPQLANVLIFLTFIILLFGILGLQEFKGKVYNRCRTTPEPVNATYWPKSTEHTQICSKEGFES